MLRLLALTFILLPSAAMATGGGVVGTKTDPSFPNTGISKIQNSITPLTSSFINILGLYTSGDTNNATDRLELHDGFLYDCIGSNVGGSSANAVWLMKFQVTDPAHPKLLKKWLNSDFTGSSLGAVLDCHIDAGGYLYLLVTQGGEGTSIQVSTSTFQIWHLDEDDGLSYVGGNNLTTFPAGKSSHPVFMAISGNFAHIGFSADVGTNTYRIVDFINKKAPVIRGGAALNVGGGAVQVNGITLSGNYARLSMDAGATNNFESVNWTSPDSPILVTVNATNIPSRAGELRCGGDNICYAAATSPTTGVMAIDYSSAPIPTMIGNLPVANGNATTVHLMGTTLVVGVEAGGNSVGDQSDVLLFVDISSPSKMSQLSSSIGWPGGRFVTSVVSDGNLVFIGGGRDAQLLSVAKVNSLISPAAVLGTVSAENLHVRQNANVDGDLRASGGLEAGPGGLNSSGPGAFSKVNSSGPYSVGGFTAFSSTPTMQACGFISTNTLASGTTFFAFYVDSAITMKSMVFVVGMAGANGSGDKVTCNVAGGAQTMQVTSTNAASAGTATTLSGQSVNVTGGSTVDCHIDTSATVKPLGNLCLEYVMQ